MQAYLEGLRETRFLQSTGRVTAIAGLTIEAAGPVARLGELCNVALGGDGTLIAEVVGLQAGRTILMPTGSTRGLSIGATVQATGQMATALVGQGLIGRVIDGGGAPLDGFPAPTRLERRSLYAEAPSPMSRPPITQVLQTGVRAIDTLLPLGQGQRIGIFAGSGVGKSTLLGMLAREVSAQINVIALIGERGREVRDFVERQLGTAGMARSVVVVATADQPALMRVRAAYTATAIAEYFREQGQQVLLMMDSITRFAMARREIGLAAGEPPTARGYTPSVFADLPGLCERCGTSSSGGAITALYTVLVEGDDFNEPISDIVRATLDGHIMLSRDLAHEGHFPAIDILQSTSRLAGELTDVPQQTLMRDTVELLATYQRNRQMVEMGAYQTGSNPALDRALAAYPALRGVLRQSVDERSTVAQALAALRKAVETTR